MKTLKKLGVLALVVIMALSFAACGKKQAANNAGAGAVSVEKTEVEKFVEDYGQELLEGFEEGLSGSGMTCESDVKAVGNDIVMTTKIKELDNLTDDQKAQMQELFNAMNGDLKKSFEGVEEAIPTLEKMVFDICEGDGDKIADIVIEF